MLKYLTGAVLAVTAFGGVALNAAPASAFPMFDPAPAAISQTAPALDQVRWVCGPYRCVRRPNYFYGYGYARPRYYRPMYRPYGFFPGYGFHRPYDFTGVFTATGITATGRTL